jgi:hypothetical protein
MAFDWGQLAQSVAPAAAQIASSYVQNRAAGKQAEAAANQTQDRNAQTSYTTDKSLDLQALLREYESQLARRDGMLKEYQAQLDAPAQRAANAVQGDILANAQDVYIDHPRANVVHANGGLRPSMFSGDTRALGGLMSKEALLSQMAGSPKPYSQMDDIDLTEITRRKAPELTDLPQTTPFDRVMSGLALGGAFATALNPPNQPTTAATIAGRPLDPRVQTGTVVPTPLSRSPY